MTTTVLDPSVVIEDPVLVVDDDARPDPEVPQRARRRSFNGKYKVEVLETTDAAAGGGKGEVLRREGLYSSQMGEGRRARDVGALVGLTKPRGRPARDRQQERIKALEAEKRRLEQELAKARFVVDVQAKLHALLETISEGADTEPKSKP